MRNHKTYAWTPGMTMLPCAIRLPLGVILPTSDLGTKKPISRHMCPAFVPDAGSLSGRIRGGTVFVGSLSVGRKRQPTIWHSFTWRVPALLFVWLDFPNRLLQLHFSLCISSSQHPLAGKHRER